MIKKFLVHAGLGMALLCGALCLPWPSQQAHAYWESPGWNYPGRKAYRFKPRFALSLSGGVHFVDTYYSDIYGDIAHPFTYGVLEVAGHLWVHPNLSIDLSVGTHLVTNDIIGASWGYVSIKPGVRARFGWFYLRGALDLAFSEQPSQSASEHRRRPVLFGFLIGAGVRVPVSHRIRFLAELDYQFLFADIFYMPFYGKIGLEFIF